MKLFATLFEKLNQSLFSFFSGILVSLSLNIFTSILMDSSRDFTVLNILAVVLMIIGSGILILESVLIQNYAETIANAKKIKMSIEQICNSPNIRRILIRLLIYLVVSIFIIVIGLFLLYCDFNFCLTK